MLTDYHLHLRSDAHEDSAREHFTEANAQRYRSAASERGIQELGVSEHIYRFEQALSIWQHPFWASYAHDDLDAYCSFVRELCVFERRQRMLAPIGAQQPAERG